MARDLETRIEELEARSDALGTKYAKLAKKRRALAAQLEAARQAWEALPREQKMERKRKELAELDERFKAEPGKFCPNIYDAHSSALELDILELAGAPREHIERARVWQQGRIWRHERGPKWHLRDRILTTDETPEQAQKRYEAAREAALQARRDWESYRSWVNEIEETEPVLPVRPGPRNRAQSEPAEID